MVSPVRVCACDNNGGGGVQKLAMEITAKSHAIFKSMHNNVAEPVIAALSPNSITPTSPDGEVSGKSA